MVYISSKSKVFDFSGEQKPPIRGSCNNRKKLKLCESALFSSKCIWIKFHQNRKYLNFPREGEGGQKRPIRGVTCDLRCLSSNLPELFHSKVMCKNLVRTG